MAISHAVKGLVAVDFAVHAEVLCAPQVFLLTSNCLRVGCVHFKAGSKRLLYRCFGPYGEFYTGDI